MPDILNKIVECENLAKEIVVSAKQQQEQDLDEMQSKIREMRKTELAKAYDEISSSTDITKRAFKDASAEIDGKFGKKVETLDERYRENKEKWLNEMFDRVVGLAEDGN